MFVSGDSSRINHFESYDGNRSSRNNNDNFIAESVRRLIIALYRRFFFLFFPVDKWRKHRRIISYAFNVKFLEQLYPVFNERNKVLIKNLRKNIDSTRPFDLWDYIISTTFDTICREYVRTRGPALHYGFCTFFLFSFSFFPFFFSSYSYCWDTR